MTYKRRVGRRKPVNKDLWLVPYADMMTLLFALFVILYSVSRIEMGKFERLQDSLWHAFIGGAARSEGREGGDFMSTGPERGDIIDGIQLMNRQNGPMRRFVLEQLPDEVAEEDGRSLEIVMDDDSLSVVSPISAYFERGSDRLSPKARSLIARLVGGMHGHAGQVRFVIEFPADHAVAGERYELCSKRLAAIWNLVKYLPTVEIYGHPCEIIAKAPSPLEWEKDTTLTLAFSNL